MFLQYEAIARTFKGWGYEEVRDMPKRIRDYWFRCAQDVRFKGNPLEEVLDDA